MNPLKVGEVRLTSVTNMEEQMTPEEAIVYMARVSSPQNQDSHDTAYKLLRFLVEKGHWSPFDMIDLTVEICTTRAIMAQILRHWSFRFQEFSQRYSEVDTVNWDHLEARVKHDKGNRQGSGNRANGDLQRCLEETCKYSEAQYKYLISKGIAPESARMVMPLATPTRAYMKGSVRSWMTYFWQRLDSHAQKEHRELAKEMFLIFNQIFPNIAAMICKGKSGYVAMPDNFYNLEG